MVVVQHTERGFASALVSWLAAASKLSVKLARDGDSAAPGEVVVAGEDAHVEMTIDGRVRLHSGDAVDGFRPSGTVLLSSLAAGFGRRALGIVCRAWAATGPMAWAQSMPLVHGGGGRSGKRGCGGYARTGFGARDRGLCRAGERLAWLVNELVGS